MLAMKVIHAYRVLVFVCTSDLNLDDELQMKGFVEAAMIFFDSSQFDVDTGCRGTWFGAKSLCFRK